MNGLEYLDKKLEILNRKLELALDYFNNMTLTHQAILLKLRRIEEALQHL